MYLIVWADVEKRSPCYPRVTQQGFTKFFKFLYPFWCIIEVLLI